MKTIFFVILALQLLVGCTRSGNQEEINNLTQEVEFLRLELAALESENGELAEQIRELNSGLRIEALANLSSAETFLLGYKDGFFPFGLAKLTGHFGIFERLGMEDVPQQCDSFIVQAAPEELLEKYWSLLEMGNSVNRMNEDGNLIMNIRLDPLTEGEQELIRNSTAERPVSIFVYIRPPTETGIGTCSSMMRVLRVEQ